MTSSLLLPLRSRVRTAVAVLCVASAALAGGCGGDEQAIEGAPKTSPEALNDQLTAPRGGDGDNTPRSADEGAGTFTDRDALPRGEADFKPPKGADAPGVPRVSARKGLRVENAKGEKPRWVVKGALDGEDFCMSVSIPGPADPDPLCQTGELLALQFFGDDLSGPAIGTITQAPLTRRESTSQMVIAGLTSGDVKRVRVRYGTKLYDAKLSDEVVDLPINQSLARELSGATRKQIDRLPDPVTVRGFGVHFPREAGNPPRVIAPETPTAVNGTITLQLS